MNAACEYYVYVYYRQGMNPDHRVAQSIPLIGAIDSLFLTLYTGARAVSSVAEAIFETCKKNIDSSYQDRPYHTFDSWDQENNRRYYDPLNATTCTKIEWLWISASDHGLMFIDNLLNTCSLGLLNACIMPEIRVG